MSKQTEIDSIKELFFEAFLWDIKENPEHLEHVYGVPISEIEKDPRKYYDMPPPEKKSTPDTDPEENVGESPQDVPLANNRQDAGGQLSLL